MKNKVLLLRVWNSQRLQSLENCSSIGMSSMLEKAFVVGRRVFEPSSKSFNYICNCILRRFFQNRLLFCFVLFIEHLIPQVKGETVHCACMGRFVEQVRLNMFCYMLTNGLTRLLAKRRKSAATNPRVTNTSARSEATRTHSRSCQACLHQERPFNLGRVERRQDHDMKAQCFKRTINNGCSTALFIKATF